MNRRVVVTGMGGLCPLGHDWPAGRRQRCARAAPACRDSPHWADYRGPADAPRRAGRRTSDARPLSAQEDAQHGPRLAARDARDRARARRRRPAATARCCTTAARASPTARPPGARRRSRSTRAALRAGAPRSGIRATDYLQFMSHTCAANLAQFFGVRGRVIPTSQRVHVRQPGHRLRLRGDPLRHARRDDAAGGAEELHPIDAAVFDILFATSTAQRRADAHAAPVRPRPRRPGGRRGRGHAGARGARARARARRADPRRGGRLRHQLRRRAT